MPITAQVLKARQKKYQETFIKEFMREFLFAVDVVAERATAKADFSDKAFQLIFFPLSLAAKLNPATDIAAEVVKKAFESVSDIRKKPENIAELYQNLNLELLEVLIKQVAQEASLRYGYFIGEMLADENEVIKFAQVGVGRLLHYLKVNDPITLLAVAAGFSHQSNSLDIATPTYQMVEVLLHGLIQGRSGKGVKKLYKNNELKGNPPHRILTAEGAYGRSGFRVWDMKQKSFQYYLLDKSAAKTKQLVTPHNNELTKLSDERKELFKQFIKGEPEGLIKNLTTTLSIKTTHHLTQPYGYVKLTPTGEAKYGYMEVPSTWATHYKYDVQSSILNQQTYDAFSQQMIWITPGQISHYLRQLTQPNSKKRFYDFIMAEVGGGHGHLQIICHGNLSTITESFQGADFSDCDFSYADFSGLNLRGVNFKRANLTAAIFHAVDAQNADFEQAQMPFLIANGHFVKPKKYTNPTNFAGANLVSANLSHANLEGATLNNIQDKVVIWTGAKLTNATMDNPKKLAEIVAGSQQAIAEIKQKITAIRRQYREKIKALKQHLDDTISKFEQKFSGKHEALNDELKLHATQIQTLLDRLVGYEAFKDDIAKHLTDLASWQPKWIQLISSVETLIHELNELQAANLTIKQTQVDLAKKFTQLQADLNQAIKDFMRICDNRLQALEGHRQLHADEIAQLKTRLAELAEAKMLSLEALTAVSKTCRQALTDKYQQYNLIKPIFGKAINIADCYINLQIIAEETKAKEAQKEGPKKEANNQSEQDPRISSFEDLFGEKQAIKVTELFKTADKAQKLPRFILMQGRAGIGKSTFSKYISYQWSAGQLWQGQFQWLFIIPLRNLARQDIYKSGKVYTIADLVYQECFALTLKHYEFDQLWHQQIAALDPQKILFVLDGYDEIAHITNDEKHPCFEALRNLLYGHHSVILTSRPYGLNNLPQERKNVEIMGFTNQDIEKYVKAFFARLANKQPQQWQVELNARGEQLLKFMRSNPGIWGTAHIPISLNLICGIYEDRSKKLDTNLSMTELYQAIETKLLATAYRTLPDAIPETQMSEREMQQLVQEPYQDVLEFVVALAYEGLLTEKLILSPELIDQALDKIIQQKTLSSSEKVKAKHHLHATALQLRLLMPTTDSHYLTRVDRSRPHEFLHLTLQEYFAAKYITKCFISADLSSQTIAIHFIRNNKFDPRYQIVFWFVAGLLRTHEKALEDYLNWLQAPPIDLIGQYKLGLFIRCFDEARYSKNLQPLLSQIEQWLLRYTIQIGKNLLSPLVQNLAISRWLMTSSSKILSGLVALLKDEDVKVRRRAAQALRQLGQASPEILSGLVALLKDEDVKVRLRAAQILRQLGQCSKIFGVLFDLRKDEDKEVRWQATQILKQLDQPNPELLSKLITLREDEDEDEEVRSRACTDLGRLGLANYDIFGDLVGMLKDEDGEVRRRTAQALEQIGQASPSFVYSVDVFWGFVALFKDEDEEVRLRAVQIFAQALRRLGQVHPKHLSELVADLLKDKNWLVRESAAQALGQLGQASPEILSGLVALLKDENSLVRESAVQALGQLGQASPEILSGFVALLKDKNWLVRESAAQVLGQLGQASPEILSGLVALLKDEDWFARESAAQALRQLGQASPEILSGWQLGQASPELLSGLVALLKDEDWEVRRRATQALGQLGQASPELLSGLVALLKDEAQLVRQYAVQVLGQLGQMRPNAVILHLTEFLGSVSTSDSMRLYLEKWKSFLFKDMLTIYLSNPVQQVISILYMVAYKALADHTIIFLQQDIKGQYWLYTYDNKKPLKLSLTTEQALFIEFYLPRITEWLLLDSEVPLPMEKLQQEYEAYKTVKLASDITSNNIDSALSPMQLAKNVGIFAQPKSPRLEKLEAFNTQSQLIIDTLSKFRQMLQLQEDINHQQLMITFDAEDIPADKADKLLTGCQKLILDHCKAYLTKQTDKVTIDKEDEIFPKIIIYAQSKDHAGKLKAFLEETHLFQRGSTLQLKP